MLLACDGSTRAWARSRPSRTVVRWNGCGARRAQSRRRPAAAAAAQARKRKEQLHEVARSRRSG
eukprot:9751042-Heterocapsa_arctica.AAC.1